jgi:N-acetyl-gamma-glutamyl-phosphate reductase
LPSHTKNSSGADTASAPHLASEMWAASVAKPILRTAIAGVSGFAGGELARILLRHPRLTETPPVLVGRGDSIALTKLHPQLSGLSFANELTVSAFDWKQLQREQIDILFLATPHEQSREWVPIALAHGIRVIDLSGAWRLQHEPNRAIYKLEDADPALASAIQTKAVYGSPELHGPQIKSARLVANPGCYATSIILALAPIVRANLADLSTGIVCDAKSGVSGAGKSLTPSNQFMYAADNLSAYAVFGHRHTGELLEQLDLASDQIQFTPHLLPIPRGILSTIYVRLNQPSSIQSIQACFDGFYADSPMVRIHRSPGLPQIQHVIRTSFCDIGFHISPDNKRLVIVSCLDNLLKGAASQAVQNMNLMAGFQETEGLL